MKFLINTHLPRTCSSPRSSTVHCIVDRCTSKTEEGTCSQRGVRIKALQPGHYLRARIHMHTSPHREQREFCPPSDWLSPASTVIATFDMVSSARARTTSSETFEPSLSLTRNTSAEYNHSGSVYIKSTSKTKRY